MNPIILNAIREDAESLIRIAQANNAVVTITLQPLQSPAMGNYVMIADVRPARHRASHSFDLDMMCNAAMAGLTAWIALDVDRHKRHMAYSYSEAKLAMEKRHRDHLTRGKTLRLSTNAQAAAEVLSAFSKALSGVTFFPPMR